MEISKQQSQCVQVCGLYFLLTYRNASTTNQNSACSAYLYLGKVQQHTDIAYTDAWPLFDCNII